MNEDAAQYKLIQRTYAGYWLIGPGDGFRVALETRPNAITRLFSKLLLQWTWVDGAVK